MICIYIYRVGKATLKNKDVYKGNFKEGEFSGYGEMEYKSIGGHSSHGL
jgi:hypothetical protein